MRVAALFSGGKDSTLAAWVVENHGWEVTHLVTVRPRASDSWMFHVPNLNLTPLIAEAWGKPLVTVETSGEEGRELGDERGRRDPSVDPRDRPQGERPPLWPVGLSPPHPQAVAEREAQGDDRAQHVQYEQEGPHAVGG